MLADSRTKSLAKTVTWRVLITVITMLYLRLFLGSWAESLGVSAGGAIISTVVYYFHERVWSRSKWRP